MNIYFEKNEIKNKRLLLFHMDVMCDVNVGYSTREEVRKVCRHQLNSALSGISQKYGRQVLRGSIVVCGLITTLYPLIIFETIQT